MLKILLNAGFALSVLFAGGASALDAIRSGDALPGLLQQTRQVQRSQLAVRAARRTGMQAVEASTAALLQDRTRTQLQQQDRLSSIARTQLHR